MFDDDAYADNPASGHDQLAAWDRPPALANPAALAPAAAWDNPDQWPAGARRNPSIIGIDLEDATATAGGVWGAINVSGLLDRFVPQGTAALDNIRPGLGAAAYQLLGAVLVGQVVGWFNPQWKQPAMLGGGALAVSNFLLAVTGQVNLIGGTPSLQRLANQLPAPLDGAVPAPRAVDGLSPQQAQSGLP